MLCRVKRGVVSRTRRSVATVSVGKSGLVANVAASSGNSAPASSDLCANRVRSFDPHTTIIVKSNCVTGSVGVTWSTSGAISTAWPADYGIGDGSAGFETRVICRLAQDVRQQIEVRPRPRCELNVE